MNPSSRAAHPERKRSCYTATTVLLDAFIVAFALGIGYAINFSNFSLRVFLFYQWKLILYSVVLYGGLGATLGLYRQAYTSPLRLQIAAALRAYVVGTLTIFATLFLFRNTYYSHGVLLTYLVLLPSNFVIGRLVLDLVRTQLQIRKWGLEPTIVILTDANSKEQLNTLVTNPLLGFDVREIINAVPLEDSQTLERVNESFDVHNPRCLIYVASALDSSRFSRFLPAKTSKDITVRLVSTEVHDALTRTRLYDYAGISLSVQQRMPIAEHIHRILKRTFDIVISAILIVLAAPLLLLIAVAIRLESSGGVLFRQMRTRAPGYPAAKVLKFRSMMNQDAESDVLVNGNQQYADEMPFKSPDDPRVTRVGRVIRKYSLDELPQLFNVFSGELSMVGPRPLPLADFKRLPPNGALVPSYERRKDVKPGITGLWQISGRSGLSFRQMLVLDLYYAENQSFLFDLEILIETIPAVISGRGAY